MNATLQRIPETEKVETPGGDALELRDHVSREEGEFLRASPRPMRRRAAESSASWPGGFRWLAGR